MRTLLAIALLCSASLAEAGPRDFVKHHKRFLLMESAATGSAIWGGYALAHCRSIGVEKCTGHYGSAWGIFGTGVGLNFAMTAVAEGCWKDGQGHFCDVFAYGGSAAQTVWGAHEFYLGGQREADTPRNLFQLTRR